MRKIYDRNVQIMSVFLPNSFLLFFTGESGITVEAFGPGDIEGCSVSQEEAKTDVGGAFRIRGLIPGCNYKVDPPGRVRFLGYRDIPVNRFCYDFIQKWRAIHKYCNFFLVIKLLIFSNMLIQKSFSSWKKFKMFFLTYWKLIIWI